MKKVKCLITRKFLESDLDFIQSKLNRNVELIIPENYSENNLCSLVRNHKVEIILGIVPSEKFINEAENLKLIQIPWNGIDKTNIPKNLKEAIKVCNSHSNDLVTAELAIGLMFALIKWIPIHDSSLRKYDWRRPNSEVRFFPSELLSGKNIGIIGFGRIGYKISEMLKGFNVQITALSKSGRNNFNNNIEVFPQQKLNEFCERNNIIFITTPLTEETKELISENQFDKMDSNTFLINVARGNIIKEEALYNALKNEKIAGAALDVWYSYPNKEEPNKRPSKFPFEKLENVVMSPHRGGFAKGLLPHLDEAIININNYADGKPLINIIDTKRGY